VFAGGIQILPEARPRIPSTLDSSFRWNDIRDSGRS
jgi:hypothetical protein